ncbi:MAG: hypothetical protein JKY31_09680 [Rhodobacteraceae bacterium]|nr:hypothetical protein [Paracoccaceae bacterium]
MAQSYRNSEDMPIADIMSEIRALVASETKARYSKDKKAVVTELLILRPEARVDLVLQEPEPSAVPKPARLQTAEEKVFATLGVSSKDELREMIRTIFHDEFEKWSES